MTYGWMVYGAFLSMLPLALLAFALLPHRRAVITVYVAGWLFLPVASFEVAGMPDISKSMIVSLSVAIGVITMDSQRLSRLRFGMADLPMLVWCLCPIPTSMSNGLGFYDGFSNSFGHAVTWGGPYILGRLYFSDKDGLIELCKAMVVGGLIYAPLCLWEVRMSPQLHTDVYGYYPHGGPGSFIQTIRAGGFRPVVFMHHGLMLGLWQSMTAFIALVLWRIGRVQRLGPLPMSLVALALVATAVLCKSLGALFLLAGGSIAVWLFTSMHLRVALLGLLLLPSLWVGVRGSGLDDGSMLVNTAANVVSEERAHSLAFRVRAENALADKARERLVLGWAGYGRGLIERDDGVPGHVIPDGLWIIAFNTYGLLGVVSWLLITLLPCWATIRRVRPDRATIARWAPATALALVAALFAIDSLVNAHINPLYVLIPGALRELMSKRAIAGRSRRAIAARTTRARHPRLSGASQSS